MPKPKPIPPERATAIRAEEDRAIIREAMSALGSRSTPAKRRAARKNGKKGGRPSTKNKKTRRTR